MARGGSGAFMLFLHGMDIIVSYGIAMREILNVISWTSKLYLVPEGGVHRFDCVQ